MHEKAFANNPQIALPRELEIVTDNTAREGVNQHFFMMNAFLPGRDLFDQAINARSTVGHTHNEQDQRFSVVGSTLARAPALETPQEFVDWTIANVKPSGMT